MEYVIFKNEKKNVAQIDWKMHNIISIRKM